MDYSNPNIYVRAWYTATFPTDEVGQTIRENVTFDDVLTSLYHFRDVYKTLGGDVDSIVRERVFAKLSEYSGLPYSRLYELWLAA